MNCPGLNSSQLPSASSTVRRMTLGAIRSTESMKTFTSWATDEPTSEPYATLNEQSDSAFVTQSSRFPSAYSEARSVELAPGIDTASPSVSLHVQDAQAPALH